MTPEERYKEDLVQEAYLTEWTRQRKERKMRMRICRMQAVTYWRLLRKNVKGYFKAMLSKNA